MGGSLGIIIIGVTNYYTMMLQIKCKMRYQSKNIVAETYSDLAYQTHGRLGKIVVDLSLYTSQIGCCVAYLLFVGKQFEQVICYQTGVCDRKSMYIMLAAMALVPVCCLRTFKFISYMSGFANASIVFASKRI